MSLKLKKPKTGTIQQDERPPGYKTEHRFAARLATGRQTGAVNGDWERILGLNAL